MTPYLGNLETLPSSSALLSHRARQPPQTEGCPGHSKVTRIVLMCLLLMMDCAQESLNTSLLLSQMNQTQAAILSDPQASWRHSLYGVMTSQSLVFVLTL